MGSEIKSKGKRITFPASHNLHKQFTKRCKQLNVSKAQRLRDLIQADLKPGK